MRIRAKRIAVHVYIFALQIVRKFTMLFWRLRLGSVGVGTKISSTARMYRMSQVRIGRNVSINDFVHIWGDCGVEIGDDTLIAAHAVIASQSHDVRAASQGMLYRETRTGARIRIGNNVWIGSNATILPGVNLGDGCVIGAGAVVSRDIPPFTLAVGVPARVVKLLKEE